jgi:hypothetical protein
VTKSHPFFQAADWEFHGEKFNIFPAGGGYQSCQQLVNNVIRNKVIAHPTKLLNMIKQIIAKMVFNMLVAVGRVNLVRQIYLCEQQ